MKILLFGANGQLGRPLKRLLATRGSLRAVGHEDLDLRDLVRLRLLIGEYRPDLIVNAAAYTAVDVAETDRENAELVNAAAPGVMAECAREHQALLVHYSTDYVFDGSADVPYPEEAPAHPLGVYGTTKQAGEAAITASGAAHLILRTAWLYSNHGRNFLNTMLRLATERSELRVVGDQTGCPTYANLLADATLSMLDGLYAQGSVRRERCGLFHATCAGSTSWHGFASRIMELAGLNDRVRVTSIATAEYPTPARRPAYSVLSNKKLARVFGIRLPDWQVALQRCMADRGAGE